MIPHLVLIYTILVIGICDILFRKGGIQRSLIWIIISFSFGYRTIELFSNLRFHPIELLIFITTIKIIVFNYKKVYSFPILLKWVGVFSIIFLVIGFKENIQIKGYNEFKNFSLIFLLFYIFSFDYVTEKKIITLFTYYIFSTSFIAIGGLIELFSPLFSQAYFGISGTINRASIGFDRIPFSFWGASTAANLILPALPMILYLAQSKSIFSRKPLMVWVIIIIDLYAIFLSGNRISWLIFSVLILLYLIFYNHQLTNYQKIPIFIFLIVFIGYIYSQPMEGRYISTFKAMSGNIDKSFDSSGYVRYNRLIFAFDKINSNPFGSGWASAGWVHSDIIQLTANIGIIPGFIFSIALLSLTLSLYKTFSSLSASNDKKNILFIMIMIMVYIIISFIANNNYVLPQSGVPLFFLWAFIYYYNISVRYEIDK